MPFLFQGYGTNKTTSILASTEAFAALINSDAHGAFERARGSWKYAQLYAMRQKHH